MNRPILFILLCLLTLLSCISCENSREATLEGPTDVPFLDDQFSVTMPSGWSLMEDLNDVADLEMGSDSNNGYLIVIVDEKSDPSTLTLASHSQATRAHLKGEESNYRESLPEYLTIGPYHAVLYQLHRTVDESVYYYWHVTIETEKYYHQFLFWNVKEKLWRNEDDFASILNSFKSI